MLKKSLCVALSFCVFLTTMPAPVRAYGPGGDVAELEPEPISAIHPIMDTIGYQPPASNREEMAYYSFVDDHGRLFDIDVNLTRKTAVVRSATGQYPAVGLSDEEVSVLGDLAKAAALSPGQRLQCGLPCVSVVIAAASLVLHAVGLVIDRLDKDKECERQYVRDSVGMANSQASCAAQAAAVSCPSGKSALPVYNVTFAGDPDRCIGPQGQCMGHVCP